MDFIYISRRSFRVCVCVFLLHIILFHLFLHFLPYTHICIKTCFDYRNPPQQKAVEFACFFLIVCMNLTFFACLSETYLSFFRGSVRGKGKYSIMGFALEYVS